MIVQARRSGFITPQGTMGSVDGAHLIKVMVESSVPRPRYR